MTDDITLRREDGILEIRFARPQKKNAITGAMYQALTEALAEAERDPAIRVAVLFGSGGSFTAGNDLQDFIAAPPAGGDAPVVRFLEALVRFPKILVAGVAGPAVGIGTTLLLHCDLVLAAPDVRFQLPFVDLALVPEAASSLLLPRLVGLQRATELLLLGEPFDAARGLELGLVNRVVPVAALEDSTLALARRVAAKPPAAVLATKRLLRRPDESPADRLTAEFDAFRTQLRSAELREAVDRFFQARKPS
jgi:enoyl-CoA hydratase/carnithine racemase